MRFFSVTGKRGPGGEGFGVKELDVEGDEDDGID